MKKYAVSIVSLLLSSAVLMQGSSAQETPKDELQAKADKPVLGDREEMVLQNKRWLKVRNDTKSTLTVFLQYRTLEKDAWKWVPADPAKSTEAVSFDLEAGQEPDVKHGDDRVAASRMRIWATSPTMKWLKYKGKDSWLVPERNDDGDHVYPAESIEVYHFIFAASKDTSPISADSGMLGEVNLPTEGEDIPAPEPDVSWDEAPEGFPVIQDLAVLPVWVGGWNATIRVRNLGHVNDNSQFPSSLLPTLKPVLPSSSAARSKGKSRTKVPGSIFPGRGSGTSRERWVPSGWRFQRLEVTSSLIWSRGPTRVSLEPTWVPACTEFASRLQMPMSPTM